MVEPVETYTTEWQTQAEMLYNGLGNRLQMTAYADGQSLTTRYELDNGRVLSADAAGNITFYLYGLGPIGELTDAWNYSLPDGSNTPRQLTDANAEITFAASYTPWGDTLETHGTGRFTQGYFGGIMDAATGLIYVGNGQYYDPSTGRFLTRDARPNQNNPYTPIDPTGALLGPLALLALAYGRKKSRGRWDMLVILLVLGLAAGLSLSACGVGEGAGMASETHDNITATVFWQAPNSDGSVRVALTVTATIPGENGAPSETVSLHCRGTLTPSLTPTPHSSPDEMDGTLPWGPKSTGFYKLYLKFYETKTDSKGKTTWWWEEYGSDGHLSIEDFVAATVFYREVATAPVFQGIDMNDYVEAMGRNAYIWCSQFSPYNCSSTTNKGLMYFVVEWSYVAKTIYNTCKPENCDIVATFPDKFSTASPTTAEWALKIVQGIKNPKQDWMNFDKNALFDAGNRHEQVMKPEKIKKMHAMGHRAHYESPDGEFFIVTFCEKVFLRNEMNLYDSWGCILPPPSPSD